MKAARELTRRIQVRAELYRAVQQLSQPSPIGADFLVNTLLTEALYSPEIIERARQSIAAALRQYEDELERRKDQQIQFFSWIQEQLTTTEINRPASSIHTHKDGLLLASPRIFQDFAKATNCTWLDCQRNIFKSLFLKSLYRHHVARYRIAGRSKKFLHCVVVCAEFCGEFFGELPAPNRHILERLLW